MKCFYHSADLDGHCSGAIIKQRYPECEMIGINYGDEFPWESIDKDEKVYMVDFGLQPFECMKKLNAMCELHWIDHHKTVIEDATNNCFLASGGQSLEIGLAGCELTYRYVYPDYPLPETVMLLGRYDVWDHSNYNVLPFQYGMRQEIDTSPDNQGFWAKMLNSNIHTEATIQTGKIIMLYEASQNEKFCKAYAFGTNIDGYVGICVNRGFTNSKIFDSVYDHRYHDLMITFCRLKDAGKWTVSLYSTKEDIDCGVIAKKYGGGGHKGAAGFQCVDLPFLY